MTNKKHIVFLGSSGFPFGLAEVQKILLISKCLILEGNDVTVICKKAVVDPLVHHNFQRSGCFEQIRYVYTAGTPFRSNHFIKRNLIKIKGSVNEILLLMKRKKEGKLDFAILSTHSFSAVLLYAFLSKILGFKTILNYVEYFSGMKESFHGRQRLNNKLYDKYAPSLADGIFPISEFLIKHIKTTSPHKKIFKIPGLTDFQRYDDIEISEGENYFLYCGSANYKEIVLFAIDAFALLNNKETFLYLVINGNEKDVSEIKNYISSNPQKENIRLFSRLSQKQLFTYYKNALALLIPLRPTFQDIARFPHKTGEYMASGNPVISTNYGEVNYYFKDMENMLLAETYDVKLFAEKMQFVIDHPLEAQQMGIKGKKIASQLFDYPNQASAINNFLDEKFNSKKGKVMF